VIKIVKIKLLCYTVLQVTPDMLNLANGIAIFVWPNNKAAEVHIKLGCIETEV